MGLLQDWVKLAYDEKADKGSLRNFWNSYFKKEQSVYEQLLASPDEAVTGTVGELAEKYDLTIMEMTGFLDGINESLVKANDLEELSEDSKVSLDFDNEKLYKNMVAAGADWLYNLPMWDDIFDEDKQKELYKEQKKSQTVVREGKKIGRNDPCPCGSGKKYKQCCMLKG